MAHSLRVIGGAEATYGSHPWLVSGQPSLFDLLFYHREVPYPSSVSREAAPRYVQIDLVFRLIEQLK